ncbi:aminoacylase [Kordiimonas sediminis]|uniref:Aminoacylase n=1 Tax=Kordiimonas sediminis TaxID=1735581 RepID=A0A919AQH3_9PROT|nr:D-aminoacylase [Kordiimonas sediminis]GHF20628.1 aminoacylase [Kordiimonas sediminis]
MRLLPSIIITMSFAILSAFSVSAHADDQRFDVIISGGQILDGTGGEAVQADIGIRDDLIVAVGDLSDASAANHIDARGKIVSPGFIDLHSHADRQVLEHPSVSNKVQQGITTILGGNCGGSPLDLDEFFATIDQNGAGPNVGILIGHNTVRKAVMGRENRLASDKEIKEMRSLVGKAMQDGAFGMSTGLKYVPGTYANTEEVVALSEVVAQAGGFYASHMREEGIGLLPAMDEALEIGRQADLPVHISHHKAVGLISWGKSKESIAKIKEARASGMDVTLDQYPYTASSTNFGVIFPAWSLAGGREALKERLADPETRQKIKDGIIHAIKTDRGGGDPARIQVAVFEDDPSLNGKTFKQILEERGVETSIENTAELAIELESRGGGSAIYHAMNEDDVRRIMQYEMTSVATDGHGVIMGEGAPHPRNYGTFPRVLGHYVREDNIITLSDAIRKMTGLPASRMGLTDRGLIKTGYFADLVIFDKDKVADKATFTDSHQLAVGIDYVLVNGVIAIDKNGYTGATSGRALRHAAAE